MEQPRSMFIKKIMGSIDRYFLCLIVIITVTEGIILFKWQQYFNGSATLITASLAFLVYFITKKDQKKDAAKIIYLEIESVLMALEKVESITIQGNGCNIGKLRAFIERESVLYCNSWLGYRHLFINDYPAEVFGHIDQFYRKAELAENRIKLLRELFAASFNEKVRFVQRSVGESIVKNYNHDGLLNDKHKYIMAALKKYSEYNEGGITPNIYFDQLMEQFQSIITIKSYLLSKVLPILENIGEIDINKPQ